MNYAMRYTKNMYGKKFVFMLALWAVFAGVNTFAADTVIYTQPYVRDAKGNLISTGTGSDGKPRFQEQCGPCAALDRMIYERDASGVIVKKLVDWGGTVTITENVPSHIASVPTLVLPSGAQVAGPSAIFSSARDYAARQMAAMPKPVPAPRATVTSVKDMPPAPKGAKPSSISTPPRKSDLSDTLPPVPGDKDYVPPKSPKGNDGWIPVPKAVRYTYSFKEENVAYVPKSGNSYEAIIERCGFDVDGKETGCEETVITVTGSILVEAKQKVRSMVAAMNAAANPKSAVPTVTPKSAIKPPAPITPPKYHYKYGKPELVDGIYEIPVISRCLLDKDGNEVSCTKITGLTLQVPKTDAPNPAKAQEMIEKYLRENGVPPEYLPQPKTKKPESPSDVTGVPALFKRPKPATVKDSFTEKPPRGASLTPAERAEYDRQIAEEERMQEELKAEINELSKKRKP